MTDLRSALDANGVDPGQWDAFDRAITSLVESEVVQLCGVDGRRVQVDARLQVSAEPEVVWWSTTDASPRESKVTGWAGPWPVVQRWWGPEPRRQVYLQASLQDGRAVLLALTDGVWTVEALYD